MGERELGREEAVVEEREEFDYHAFIHKTLGPGPSSEVSSAAPLVSLVGPRSSEKRAEGRGPPREEESRRLTLALCRICQNAEADGELISPCRCSGSLKWVHRGCLVRWLETRGAKGRGWEGGRRRERRPAADECELCGYPYQSGGCCCGGGGCHLPAASSQDRLLHWAFALLSVVCVSSAVLSLLFLRSDKGYRIRSSLNTDDIVVIAASVLFFSSFFLAVFTQYKAEVSIFRLASRLCDINRHWRIRNYDPRRDRFGAFDFSAAHQPRFDPRYGLH